MFTVTSMGAARQVTGSAHLLEAGERQVLLDCGLHQGGDAVKRMRRERFDFNPRALDAVILSHAHLDHSGRLPMLVRHGYRGPIWCTPATRNLLAIMLEDAASIYFRDLEGLNLRRQRAGKSTLEPEYEMEDVLRVLKQCEPLPYHEEAQVASGITLKFLDAGHILGSAVVELHCEHDGEQRTLVFSGDLGHHRNVLMKDPDVPFRADLVLMEGTYGNRDHRPLEETLVELEGILATAEKQGGVVVMPAFAVGRTQEFLFHLGSLWHRGALRGWRVFLDSPMAIAVTRLYDQWLDVLDEKDQRLLEHYGAGSLETFLPILALTPGVEESMQLNRIRDRAIIIAGSGMCNGGRVRHHLKHRLWRAENHIVFAGFQARGTLGRQLVDGNPTVTLFGHRYAVHARVHTLGAFSAHAGRSQLLAWAKSIEGQPHIRLVHGESDVLDALAGALSEQGHDVSVAQPEEQWRF